MTENRDARKRRSEAWGPVSDTVAGNLLRLRKARGLTTTALSEALKGLGQSIPASGITRIEKGDRRVDVDDLVALALALNVSPVTLLLPPTASLSQRVSLTSEREVSGVTAWSWAVGQRPALDWVPGEGLVAAAEAGADASTLMQAQERDLENLRQQQGYDALALPEEVRRRREHPSMRLVLQLRELLEDLINPELGVDRAGQAARGRLARRRFQQLGLELEQIVESLDAPPHLSGPLSDPSMTTEEVRDLGEEMIRVQEEAVRRVRDAVEDARRKSE